MIIDFRSDTVTKPTKEMLRYMMKANVGDDVYGEDPSVNELQEYAAKLFKKDSALFCASGTMSNQIAIKISTNSPGELICEEMSHIYKYEGGGIAFNSGISTKLIKGDKGRLTACTIESSINPKDIHFPENQLVCIENTSNKGGGTIYDFEEMKKIRKLCVKHNLRLHLDGARVFNAIVESNYSAVDIGPLFNTISICLSKGLGAPVGSLLLGNHSDIEKARRIRKIIGGGMRQSGYIAAAGLFALKNNIHRLKEDHIRAKALAEELKALCWVKNVLPVYTNIVIVETHSEKEKNLVIDKLNKLNVKCSVFGPCQIRFVTHLDITDELLHEAIKRIKNVF